MYVRGLAPVTRTTFFSKPRCMVVRIGFPSWLKFDKLTMGSGGAIDETLENACSSKRYILG